MASLCHTKDPAPFIPGAFAFAALLANSCVGGVETFFDILKSNEKKLQFFFVAISFNKGQIFQSNVFW